MFCSLKISPDYVPLRMSQDQILCSNIFIRFCLTLETGNFYQALRLLMGLSH